jgi:hypothetical protein
VLLSIKTAEKFDESTSLMRFESAGITKGIALKKEVESISHVLQILNEKRKY